MESKKHTRFILWNKLNKEESFFRKEPLLIYCPHNVKLIYGNYKIIFQFDEEYVLSKPLKTIFSEEDDIFRDLGVAFKNEMQIIELFNSKT